MRTKTKFLNAFLIVFMVAVLAFAACEVIFYNSDVVSAETEQEGYYYNQLPDDAKRFYDAIAEMNDNGLLKQGNAQYDLISSGVLTSAQLESFSHNSSVMVAFGAARDAFYLDHPEVFYVDFSHLSVSVGTKNGNYIATLGTGRSDSYYVSGGFTSEGDVNEAILKYNAEIEKIVNTAKVEANAADMIKVVNASLVEKIDHSFCSDSQDAAFAPHIRTSYGALVNGKAVCEGFARSFKCVMDKLQIPSVIVQGYASNDGGLEPHAWNYVKLDGSWYGVDVTWNNGTGKTESYLLLGDTAMNLEHITDGIISAAGFKFVYPALTLNNYGVSVESNLDVEVGYEDSTQSDAKLPFYKISKDGKNASELKAENQYLVYRYCYNNNDSFAWSDWMVINEITGGENLDGYTKFKGINNYCLYVQFAIFDYAPDTPFFEGSENLSYNPDNLKEINFVDSTDIYVNEEYGSYFAPPYIESATPTNVSPIEATKDYTMIFTYSEALKLEDDTKGYGISLTTIDPNAKNYVVISDIKWDPTTPNTITFSFTPSAMYQHRSEHYTFIPTNLIGKDSEKQPMPIGYDIKNESVVCNKIYGDGRLYVNAYGQPSLVGSGDLSLNGWKDDKGNPVSENQRSQLMLVASKTTEREGNEMLDNINLPDGAIKSAQTFELQMNICKNIVRIPNGSTVQLAFGFPEGYGPDDAGVTFKVYHFHRCDDGKIDYSLTEEIDCIVTEYGLIVNVSDFSPFAVVAVDKAQSDTNKKSVFARSVGFGGTFEGDIAKLVSEGESVTYTLKPDDGYHIAKVTLNGENVDISNNTVTLGYEQLSSTNTVEVHYIADSVAEYEQEEGITAIYPCVETSVKDSSGETPNPDDGNNPDDNPDVNDKPEGGNPAPEKGKPLTTAHIIVIVIACLIVLVAAIVITVVIINKKRKGKC